MWDLENVQEQQIVPAGWHQAKISKVEFKESKAGSEYLNLTFSTDKGNVFSIMNINHPSDMPRNIALAELKGLLKASGCTDFKFASKEALADALSTVICQINVAHKTDSYGTKAAIKGYKASVVSETDSNVPF